MPSQCHFRARTPNRHWTSVRVRRSVSALGQQAPRQAIPETEQAVPVHSTEEVGRGFRFWPSDPFRLRRSSSCVTDRSGVRAGVLDPTVRTGQVLTVSELAFAGRDLPTKFRIFRYKTCGRRTRRGPLAAEKLLSWILPLLKALMALAAHVWQSFSPLARARGCTRRGPRCCMSWPAAPCSPMF